MTTKAAGLIINLIGLIALSSWFYLGVLSLRFLNYPPTPTADSVAMVVKGRTVFVPATENVLYNIVFYASFILTVAFIVLFFTRAKKLRSL